MDDSGHEYRRAIALYQSRRNPREVEAICQRIVAGDPAHSAAWNLLGLLAFESGRHGEAIRCLRKSCELAPMVGEFHNALGGVLASLGRHEEAIGSLRHATRLSPNLVAAYINLGAAFTQLQRLGEAADAFRKVFVLRSESPEAMVNFSNTLRLLHRLDEAEDFARRALRHRADWPEAINTLGAALLEQKKMAEARQCFESAIRLNPGLADAHYNLAVTLLSCGELERGWHEFAWRRDARGVSHVTQPWGAWTDADLSNKTVLIDGEGGLGNVIQFARYIPWVAQRGARVTLRCQPKLTKLLKSVEGVSDVVALSSQLRPDIRIPLRSLPALFATTLENIPASVPYLKPDPTLVGKWTSVLTAIPGFRIGVCWQGSQELVHRRNRSFPSSMLMPLAHIPGVRLVSLQKEADPDPELPIVRFPEFDEANGGFMDTAAMMTALDLVITCDTSVAHLAGALNVPVWVALPFASDWRWLLDRSDSPWYPSMRLYRQPHPGDWETVMRGIATELRCVVAGTSFGRKSSC